MITFFSKKKSQEKAELKAKNDKLMSEFQNSKNPYLHAKYEWNERYGSFIQEAKTWKMVSFGLIIGLIVCLIGFISLAVQSRITAYFVKTDQMGKPIVIEAIDPSTKINSSVVAYQLGEFITEVRTVTTDGKLKKMWMKTSQKYCSDTAWNTLQDYWTKNPPDKIAQMMNISVAIDSVLPIKATESWEVHWVETATKNGEPVGSTKWTAILNIGIKPMTKEQEFILNPTGLMIKSINWMMVK